MAIYNTEKYVGEAIESVIRTFDYAKIHDQEIKTYLIIRNDGSTDNSRDEVVKKMNKHSDIHFFDNPQNMGILKTRRLLLLDSYNFVNSNNIENEENIFLSFMDSDDICVDTRALHQLREMMSDPSLKSCGGQALLFNDNPTNNYEPYGFLTQYKEEYEDVKVDSIFQASSLSPFMSFRYDWVKNRIENLNDSKLWANYRMGEDWSFVVEFMSEKDFKYKNMNDVLIYYRKHEKAMTSTVTDGIGTDQYHIRNTALSYIGLNLTDEEHRLLITISPCRHWAIFNVDFFRKNQKEIYQMSESLINKILSANENSKFYKQDYLKYYTDKILLNVKKHEKMECKDIPIMLKVI